MLHVGWNGMKAGMPMLEEIERASPSAYLVMLSSHPTCHGNLTRTYMHMVSHVSTKVRVVYHILVSYKS